MVELREVIRKGKTVWVEVPPDVCPPCVPLGFRPLWTGCVVCRAMCRHWSCMACERLTVDAEHVHAPW